MTLFKSMKVKRTLKKLKALRHSRMHNQPKESDLKQEFDLYLYLAKLYHSLIGNNKYPFAFTAEIACYRQAADMDVAKGHYLLAQALINQARWRENIQEYGVLDGEVNDRIRLEQYQEGHAHLNAAVKMEFFEAERLLGLCYVKAYGVDVDQDKGFGLIVSSINREGSWDRLPQIFESMGLNKPEFFAQVMQQRNR